MNITWEDARLSALESIAEAYRQFDEGNMENTMVALTVAKAYVDVLQRMQAGASNFRIESITFGDGPAPFEVTVQKRRDGE